MSGAVDLLVSIAGLWTAPSDLHLKIRELVRRLDYPEANTD